MLKPPVLSALQRASVNLDR